MKQVFLWVGCMALCLLFVGGASALSFDQNVTNNAIFGGGNTNGSYTVDRSNGVEIGLRGKLRHNGVGAPENTYNSNGDGTYSFAAGVAPTQVFPTAVWSFEWSINTDYLGTSGLKLDDLTYQLCLDSDVSQAVNYTVAFDLINGVNPSVGVVAWDHSVGDNTTAQGAGTEAVSVATYAALIAGNNLAQNSWKPSWYFGAGFDPTLDATYNIKLSAFDTNGLVAESEIQIIVGVGGDPVPEPATLALVGSGAAALLARRRKRV